MNEQEGSVNEWVKKEDKNSIHKSTSDDSNYGYQ